MYRAWVGENDFLDWENSCSIEATYMLYYGLRNLSLEIIT